MRDKKYLSAVLLGAALLLVMTVVRITMAGPADELLPENSSYVSGSTTGSNGTNGSSAAKSAGSGGSASKNSQTAGNGSKQGGRSLVNPSGEKLETRFSVPSGYVRVPAEAGSLGAFLRSYPMKPDGSPVLLYDGRDRGTEDHAAVFAMHLEPVDEQQCADSVMRIFAEYFRATGQEDRIKFHFVSGFLCDWNTWKQGYRVSVSGNDVSWVKKTGPDCSDECFERYLTMVFAYASTLSMGEESVPIALSELQIGDVFLRSGAPGHVTMVVDMCEKDGKKAFLLAQGYMPAQEFHVLKNLRHPSDPWYYEDEVVYPFETPGQTFAEGTLRRMEY